VGFRVEGSEFKVNTKIIVENVELKSIIYIT
jgi:hypothetical protein